MRLWRDSDGSILTDEQVLRYIAAFGSISAARDAGDIELVSKGSAERRQVGRLDARSRRLGDYLVKEEPGQ